MDRHRISLGTASGQDRDCRSASASTTTVSSRRNYPHRLPASSTPSRETPSPRPSSETPALSSTTSSTGCRHWLGGGAVPLRDPQLRPPAGERETLQAIGLFGGRDFDKNVFAAPSPPSTAITPITDTSPCWETRRTGRRHRRSQQRHHIPSRPQTHPQTPRRQRYRSRHCGRSNEAAVVIG